MNHEALFSICPVTKSTQAPLVIVGLPRSGSSFLAHVTSHLKDWFIFDDLYLYREAKAIHAINAPLTNEQLDKLLFFLGWQIRARIKFGVFCVPKMSLDEVDLMNQALKETFKGQSIYWYQLQEEWMTRLSLNQGCLYWGYKAPQDFQLTDLLDKVYPNIKYIFLYRDPRKMLRSLKYVGDKDGNPKQYHPLIYSYYWKKSIAKLNYLSHVINERILPVKYEDLIQNPQVHAEKIAHYLNTSITQVIDIKRTNSSFNSSDNKDITPTEKKICEWIIGNSLEKKGYTDKQGKFRFIDSLDLIQTTWTFTLYQIKRIVLNKSARVSIFLYIKNFLK